MSLRILSEARASEVQVDKTIQAVEEVKRFEGHCLVKGELTMAHNQVRRLELRLPGIDLTVIAEEFRLTKTVIKWKANYDLTKEWCWLPPIW